MGECLSISTRSRPIPAGVNTVHFMIRNSILVHNIKIKQMAKRNLNIDENRFNKIIEKVVPKAPVPVQKRILLTYDAIEKNSPTIPGGAKSYIIQHLENEIKVQNIHSPTLSTMTFIVNGNDMFDTWKGIFVDLFSKYPFSSGFHYSVALMFNDDYYEFPEH